MHAAEVAPSAINNSLLGYPRDYSTVRVPRRLYCIPLCFNEFKTKSAITLFGYI